MIANVSYIFTNDKMAKRQRYFEFIKIFKKNRTSKTQYLPVSLGMGCAFGKEDLLKPSKTKVQGKPYETN
jgi:hypothetical protein